MTCVTKECETNLGQKNAKWVVSPYVFQSKARFSREIYILTCKRVRKRWGGYEELLQSIYSPESVPY